jgi:sodium-dependent dicarboxylate transporter 2/3/5
MPNTPHEATVPTQLTLVHRVSTSTHTTSSLLLGPLVAFLIWSLPLEIEPSAQSALAIVAFMIVYWVMEPIDHGLTALIGCYLFWALDIAKFSVAFSGFVNTTPWFLFGALMMGEAAARTGLVKRLGFMMMRRVGTSYRQVFLGFLVLSFLLTFFVPSGLGRLVVLGPMAVGILKALSLSQHSNIAKGLFVALTYTCGLFDLTLMAGAASILTRGIVEEQTGIQILWSEWLIAFLPLTLVNIFVSLMVVRWLFPPETNESPRSRHYFRQELQSIGPWTSAEKKTLTWILCAVALWATDFAHHISPAVIGLGAGLVLSLPRIGVLEKKSLNQINFFLIIFAAGALSMGNVLAATNSFEILTDLLAQWLRPLLVNDLSYALTLYLAGFLYHFVVANRQTLLATSLPVLLPTVAAFGFEIVPFALLWTFAGGGALFIYQSGIYVMGYSYGYFQAKDFIKFGALMTLIQGVLLLLIIRIYWPLIGLNWIQ